ncbi:SDR family NAD(P)-dependent oxidoreductase [Sandarakinorhabdus limnophila]|jgi:NAD(P)-dependent dehydrogenase (short-subunit alcohol dehydrogenase family)|uniref:SDR family NAD(P)-dependent oxidoreductase n=1 Tax=Sandarakinorhabdus limnophila TaxID=210512 RepID=UPI0023561DEC|nr:SDR family NAD(P)-dependent oxidoreductase [Sandarakinorhabdus limnophila]
MTDITTKKLALVTGASRGIGAATAEMLAREGWHVIITARTEAGLAELDDRIHKAGGSATIAPFDLADYDAIDRLGNAIGARWGRLDALILNAAQLGTLAPVPHLDLKEWDKLIALNLTANMRLIRALDPWLRQSAAGHVVAVTSSVAASPRAYWGGYAATKAALENLVATYGEEVKNVSAIRTHIIDPGATRTVMRARAYPGEDPTRLKPPEDAARLILDRLG